MVNMISEVVSLNVMVILNNVFSIRPNLFCECSFLLQTDPGVFLEVYSFVFICQGKTQHKLIIQVKQ